MTGLLYELFYVLTAAVGIFSVVFSGLFSDEEKVFSGILMLLITLASAGLFVLFKRLKGTGRVIVISVVVALVIAGVFLSRNEEFYTFISEHRSYLWLPVIGTGAFLLGELMTLTGVIRILVSAAAVGWMILGTLLSYPIDKLFVAAGFCSLLLTLTEAIQRRWKKQGYVEPKKHVVTVAPFILIAVILIGISPAPEDPYDWNLARKIAEGLTGLWEILVDQVSVDFSIGGPSNPADAVMGFSEKGRITGSIHSGKREVMVITGLSSYVDQLRLAGKTFSDFDGREWVDAPATDEASASPTILMDTISLWSSLHDYTNRINDYAHKMNIDVRFRWLRSGHAFLPVKSTPTRAGMDMSEYRESDGIVLWPEERSVNSTYTVSYYTMNTESKAFQNYLKGHKLPSRESYSSAEYRINSDHMSGCGYDDLLRYVDYVKKTYRDAPVLSPPLRKHMDSVYRGAATDIEKLNRLKNMLREFTYTLTPGELPKSIRSAEDFLDYFVLKSKKGFCVHFATAFVLLARAEGIPARYVQGFLTNTGGRTSVTVKNADAHAWPEVYLEGAGWIPYEPTPAYEASDSAWLTAKEIRPPSDTLEEEVLSEDLSESSPFRTFHMRWYMIVIPVAAAILFLILVFVLRKLLFASRFQRLEDGERFVILCRQNLRILKLSGLGMLKNETLHEYRIRLSEQGIKEGAFLDELEKHLYRRPGRGKTVGVPEDALSASSDTAGREMGAAEIAAIEKESLLTNLKSKSKWKYLFYFIGSR